MEMKTAKTDKTKKTVPVTERSENLSKDTWTRNRQTVRKMIIDGKEAIVFM